MHRSIRLFAAVFVLRVATLCGQTGAQAEEKNWAEICARATKEALLAPTFSTAMAQSELEHCDSAALYYGFDRPPNSAAALQCAYYQRAHPRPQVGDTFYGSGVLAMIYANGRGVPRNFGLAIRFACENTWAAEAEMELRIGHLERLRDQRTSPASFDLCDDGTSGLMEGACADIRKRFADRKRRDQLNAIAIGWSSRVREAFKLLQSAEDAFVKTRIRREVDLSGTGRTAFMLEEEDRLNQQFIIDLQRFAKNAIPRTAPTGYDLADKHLNDVYRRILNSPDDSWTYGTIKPEGIRETQRVWLQLRAAWIDFARIAYPELSASTVLAQITQLRSHQLQSLLPR